MRYYESHTQGEMLMATRRAVKQLESEKTIKPKFKEERERTITPLTPLNPLQAQYINYIQSKKLTIATGYPGTSKTYIPTVMACDMWRKGEIKRICLTRPNVSNSKSLGFFSGSLVEKMTNWLLPVLDVMNHRLGKEVVEIAIKHGDIAFIPLETIKGMSFGPDTFVICDEAEDLTIAEAKAVITRQGGGKMVLAGDLEQSALDEKSGLLFLKNMVEQNPQLEKYTGFVDFNRPSDIVRSEECKAWILAMRNTKN
jgi:phosphate starvation-inducible PhoH-like protein